VESTAGLLLKLLLAHTAGDFVLQPDEWASNKRDPRLLARHLLVHAALLAAVVLTEAFSLRLVLGCVWILATHAAIDSWTSRATWPRGRQLAVDQVLHVAAILLAAWIVRPGGATSATEFAGSWLGQRRLHVFLLGALVTVWVGAVVVGRAVKPFADKVTARAAGGPPGIEKAGRFIGMCERWIVFVAILLRVESLVGFVIAAKALLRLPETREPDSRTLAEYYLAGSLMSLLWSVSLGFLTRLVLEALP
jgi:hypothetical protein